MINTEIQTWMTNVGQLTTATVAHHKYNTKCVKNMTILQLVCNKPNHFWVCTRVHTFRWYFFELHVWGWTLTSASTLHRPCLAYSTQLKSTQFKTLETEDRRRHNGQDAPQQDDANHCHSNPGASTFEDQSFLRHIRGMCITNHQADRSKG